MIHTIVFVGILDHFGPADDTILNFDISDSKDIVQSIEAYKYFISIELPELLWQFYSRYSKIEKNDQFWRELSNKQIVIPNSTYYIENVKRTQEW